MEVLLNRQQAAPLFAELAEQGLVLATLVAVRQLSAAVWLDAGETRKAHGSLLLLGHGGRLFWQRYRQAKSDAADPVNHPVNHSVNHPVDHFSAAISEQALQQHLPAIKRERLFPSTQCPVNLMALGREVGWHNPSPLGMGINPEYGMWSAYRALWWLDAEVEAVALPAAAPDICAGCETQDCVQACPAGALRLGSMPNLQQCADFRLQPDSACQSTCLARMACPIAEAHRYSREQMAYHYDLARSQIYLFSSRYKNKDPNHG